MFDSLKVKIDQFQIAEGNFFSETRSSIEDDGQGGRRAKKYIKTNEAWRKQMLKRGIYVPVYWTDRNSFEGRPYFYLQISAPKMLYGHSNIMVWQRDFNALVSEILKFCEMIKVSVSRAAIEAAVVGRMDVCQNIPYSTIEEVANLMSILSNFNYRKRSDFVMTPSDVGEWVMLQFRTRSSQSHFTVYNKLKAIIAEAVTIQEKGIADYVVNPRTDHPYKHLGTPNARVEASYHNATSVKQAMWNFLPKKQSYTFKEVFQDHIAAGLLKTEVDQIYNHPLKAIAANAKEDFRLLRPQIRDYIEQRFCHSELKATLQQAAAIVLADGWAGVRKYYKNHGSPSTYKRNIKRLKELDAIGISLGTPNEKVLADFLGQFGITSEAVQKTLF